MRLPSPFARLGSRRSPASEIAEVVRSTAETVLEEVGRRPAHRGPSVVTVAAVTATAVVATAAYVWWRRRDHIEPRVAVLDRQTPTSAAPVVAPAAAVVEPMPTVEVEPAVASAPVSEYERIELREEEPPATATEMTAIEAAAEHEECNPARTDVRRPAVASSPTAYSRPPVASGRFAMPGVRNFVLPSAGRSLP